MKGLLKAHHGIMKSDALFDYQCVKLFCKENGIDVIEPKGQHWHKVEDATALMLKKAGWPNLGSHMNKNNDYYKSI